MSRIAYNLFILRIFRKSLKVIEINNYVLKCILEDWRIILNNDVKQNEYIIFLF